MTANPHTPPSLAAIIEVVEQVAGWKEQFGIASTEARQDAALLREAVRLLESLQAPSPGGQIPVSLLSLVGSLRYAAVKFGKVCNQRDSESDDAEMAEMKAADALLTAITTQREEAVRAERERVMGLAREHVKPHLAPWRPAMNAWAVFEHAVQPELGGPSE